MGTKNTSKQTRQKHYRKIADALAVLLDNDLDLPDYLNQALEAYITDTMMKAVDITRGDVTRRLYPILREIAEENATASGLNFAQMLRQDEEAYSH